MWRRAPAARPLPRRGRCRLTPGLLRAALAAAACTCLAWAALAPLLPHAPSSAGGARLRVAVRPRGDPGATASRGAAAAGNQSAAAGGANGEDAWSGDWDAADDEQGPGSAQWRAQQAGVEHLLRVMAAARTPPPAFDAPAAARERAAFAPPGWAAAAAAAADPTMAREAAGAAFAAACGGAPAGAGGQLAARQAAAAERLRVVRLDAAAAAHWTALDLPTLDQPDPAARRCAAARPPSTCVGARGLATVSAMLRAHAGPWPVSGEPGIGCSITRQTVGYDKQALPESAPVSAQPPARGALEQGQAALSGQPEAQRHTGRAGAAGSGGRRGCRSCRASARARKPSSRRWRPPPPRARAGWAQRCWEWRRDEGEERWRLHAQTGCLCRRGVSCRSHVSLACLQCVLRGSLRFHGTQAASATTGWHFSALAITDLAIFCEPLPGTAPNDAGAPQTSLSRLSRQDCAACVVDQTEQHKRSWVVRAQATEHLTLACLKRPHETFHLPSCLARFLAVLQEALSRLFDFGLLLFLPSGTCQAPPNQPCPSRARSCARSAAQSAH